MKGVEGMEKYLLSLPKKMKSQLKNLAKTRGFTLNGFILEILWQYIEAKPTSDE